ncbi:SusC/RagA family TonB-linked outer membrane protein [Imperialibacter roseus]|uniref:SusC/RagA family TonB-linked outer membrane protein n=1 Tax=Imperialibacter roseus TaxID=1324217 RepID=A0ABZ0IMD3_9BACT|nr:SusC/RagA family TonB-linked outer membrane protein [Imperialibacter roseus]WOK06180.1 SusC/RagA family TonB-linked outer membrane protein [Imperialibacter roseus]|tara:strand:+ start:50666 stop:53761 length:3096 start_codon:yes stop_codon:yes gene_type:complete
MKKKLTHLLVFCLLGFYAHAQNRVISGKVTDEEGGGLPGVNISVKGTSVGTVTDVEGDYKITMSADGTTLVFSFIGFTTQEVEVGSRSVIDISMTADFTQLDEVVVTSFGLEKDKKSLGYSVTQVSGDQFTDSRTTNLGNALTGKIAGVNVSTPASGAAGSSRVIIRGGSSLGGSDQPLYVVNGVPMDNSTLGSAGMWGGNDGGDGLSSINPDDIESLSVLKGNTAAALYGARAANGVILITTKSGKSRKGVGVSFNSNFTMDNVIDLTDFQKEYGIGVDGEKPANETAALDYGNSSWGGKLDGSSVVQFDGVSRPYSDTGETIKDFYRTGKTWTNTLALSGGNEKGNFRFSASDLNNDDIMPNASFDRKLFTTGLNGAFGNLELKLTGQYSKEKAINRPRLSDSPGNANYAILTKPASLSYETLKGDPDKLGAKEDGTEFRYQGSNYIQNPYWAAYQFNREDNKDRVLGNIALKYNFFEWLYVQGRVGTDFVSVASDNYEPYGTAYATTGSFNQNMRTIREDNADMFIGVNKTFGDISVDGLVGGNRMRKTAEQLNAGGSGLNIPFFHSVTNVTNQAYSYSFSEYGINSIFGSANIGFRNYLFLNVTGRQDKFSTLADENNSLFYPSAGLSFVFSDVFTMPEFFTFGKVRASWAQVGGGAPDPYSLNLTYGLVGQGHQGAVLGSISNGSIPNAALQPYISSEIEVGFDVRLLDNRIGIDLAYYDRTTTDDILNTTISGTSGFGSTTINVGELSNKGVELLLKGTPIVANGFRWDVSFNYAHNISNVINLGTNALGEPIEFLNLDEARTQQERIRHYVGQPLGAIAGYKQMEIDGQKVYDADGYPVRGDFDLIAPGRHPVSAGISNTFTYKNFTLDFLIDIRSGGYLASSTNVVAYNLGLHKETLPGRENGLSISGVDEEGQAQTWNIAPENVDNYYSRYSQITDNFVYNASFGKLRSLSLGYSLPSTLLAKTPIESLRFSIVGRNLALLWSSVPNIDPESAYNNSGNAQGLDFFAMPTTRNFGFNLSASF